MTNAPIAITISRQLGCGGAYLGHKIAKKLGFLYLDHEIITRGAGEFKMLEETLESKDEKITSFWEKIVESFALQAPDNYMPPQAHVLTDRELFDAESKVITEAAQKNNVVIIGRCGTIALKEHPRHLSVFLHAPTIFRMHRVKKLYKVSNAEALRRIQKSDTERSQYFKTFSGSSWFDVRNYTLSINTGTMGLENAEKLILDYIHAKLNDDSFGLKP